MSYWKSSKCFYLTLVLKKLGFKHWCSRSIELFFLCTTICRSTYIYMFWKRVCVLYFPFKPLLPHFCCIPFFLEVQIRVSLWSYILYFLIHCKSIYFFLVVNMNMQQFHMIKIVCSDAYKLLALVAMAGGLLNALLILLDWCISVFRV